MTTDNSSYTKIARNTASFGATYEYKNTNLSCMIDVTNTTNDKIKFMIEFYLINQRESSNENDFTDRD